MMNPKNLILFFEAELHIDLDIMNLLSVLLMRLKILNYVFDSKLVTKKTKKRFKYL